MFCFILFFDVQKELLLYSIKVDENSLEIRQSVEVVTLHVIKCEISKYC